jgi:membrane-associated phospholipid phosphatase
MTASRRSELLLFLAAYVLYNLGRGLAIGGEATAQANAEWIIRLERGAGLERAVQHALSASWLAVPLSYVYLAAQFVVLPGALIWLYRRAPAIYRRLRNTVIATWALAVPVYVLFPVAPPRLAGIGIADTVSHQAAVSLTGRSTMLYNQLAAVPSLHVGFAVAVGTALAFAVRRPWAKVAVALWGPIVALTVVATGNHYLFDIAAGVGVTAAGLAAGVLVDRRNRRCEGWLRPASSCA